MPLKAIAHSSLLFLFVGCVMGPTHNSDAKPKDEGNKTTSLPAGPFQIPQDAKFEILSYKIDPAQNRDAEACKDERPTEAEIRRQFQISHQLEGRDLHDNYLWSPCYAEGTISRNGKVMRWRFRIGNVIETNFPDGKEKLLGGEPTDQ